MTEGNARFCQQAVSIDVPNDVASICQIQTARFGGKLRGVWGCGSGEVMFFTSPMGEA